MARVQASIPLFTFPKSSPVEHIELLGEGLVQYCLMPGEVKVRVVSDSHTNERGTGRGNADKKEGGSASARFSVGKGEVEDPRH